jgi:hypothetical protein
MWQWSLQNTFHPTRRRRERQNGIFATLSTDQEKTGSGYGEPFLMRTDAKAAKRHTEILI